LSELRSRGAEKTASADSNEDEQAYFLKLAERCERAAVQPLGANAKDLAIAEKTATIAVIARTLGEIEAIAGGGSEKTAGEDPRNAAFVERALAAGHAPEAVALFMKEAGLASRGAHQLLGRGHVGVGETLKRIGGRLSDRGTGHLGAALRDAAENLSPTNAARYIDQLRARYGDARVRQLIESSGAKLDHVPSVRDLLTASAEGAAPPGAIADRLKGAAVPAAAAVGGLGVGKALFGAPPEDKKKTSGAAEPKSRQP
jgi:hypothetical protein